MSTPPAFFRAAFLRFVNLFRKQKLDRELSAELESHLQLHIEDNLRAGMSQIEARREAMLKLGGVEPTKENYRDQRGFPFLDSAILDLRFALRTLRKSPGFAAVAIFSLSIGIGANSAIFSVIEAVSLRPLPYKNPKRLVLLADSQDPEGGAFLFKDIESFKSESHSFEDIAVYYRDSGFSKVTLTTGDEPESVQGAFVSANFFHLMGVEPTLGRVFMADEEARGERVVVLSYGLWRKRFGGSRDAIGKVLQIDGLDSQIIGVMPATFQFPARDQQFWTPLTTNRYWNDPALTTNIDPRHTRYFYERWQAIGRLSTGATVAQAQTETNAVFRRSEADFDNRRSPRIRLTPLRVTLGANVGLALIVLFCAVSFVLLISCVNVASLMLARGVARGREMAMRAVLGAGPRRLSRLLLTESAVLGALAGLIGLAFASVSVRLLIAFGPPNIPRLEQAGLDRGTLAFTLAVSLLVTSVLGLVPAWRISRNDPGDLLRKGIRSGGHSLTRTRSVLVVAELALAVVLLANAGLLLRSFLALEAVDLGFEPENVLTMSITLPSGTAESRNALL